eukprot:CAMPEP_0206464560 /NCGR_PEP_ID=MMETSP0324_2-20121206/27291_1 /ASSEMBLY_ACC=CAM_ASM_000836 /TAXON_ID=2866 /ORGANISM="Crypthecodinium cohnii, Strain Seligo" /LENGTH=133 /DNA_ID=CAMNT_0053937219 /DNA_START=130 /DNA_END=528 /DNA_ORIENTATION=-
MEDSGHAAARCSARYAAALSATQAARMRVHAQSLPQAARCFSRGVGPVKSNHEASRWRGGVVLVLVGGASWVEVELEVEVMVVAVWECMGMARLDGLQPQLRLPGAQVACDWHTAAGPQIHCQTRGTTHQHQD